MSCTREMTVGQFTVPVDITGPENGTPVLALHGFPQSRACWHRVSPLLAEAGLRIAAPDLRGYTAHARPVGSENYTPEMLLGDVDALLDSLGWEQAHLVGHDWGAAVAWAYAATVPHRTHTLTALSVPHPTSLAQAIATDPDQQRRSAYIGLFATPDVAEHALLDNDAAGLRSVFGGSSLSSADIDSYVAPLQAPGALTGALEWYRGSTVPSWSAATGPVTVPTTYVWSDHDTAIGRVAAEGTSNYVTGDYQWVELPGVSHWLPDEVPHEVAQAVVARTSALA
jgi:pimeloyl-ACP methyl ester carboxylesterase